MFPIVTSHGKSSHESYESRYVAHYHKIAIYFTLDIYIIVSILNLNFIFIEIFIIISVLFTLHLYIAHRSDQLYFYQKNLKHIIMYIYIYNLHSISFIVSMLQLTWLKVNVWF